MEGLNGSWPPGSSRTDGAGGSAFAAGAGVAAMEVQTAAVEVAGTSTLQPDPQSVERSESDPVPGWQHS